MSALDLDSRSLTTGWDRFDSTTGGLRRGEITFVSGPPFVGKSSWVTNTAIRIGIEGKQRIVYFSFDHSSEALGYRFLTLLSGVPPESYLSQLMTVENWERLKTAADMLALVKIQVDDRRTAKIEELAERCDRLSVEGGKIDLIVIDSLDRIPSVANQAKEAQEALQSIAIRHDCAILAVASEPGAGLAISLKPGTVPGHVALEILDGVRSSATPLSFRYNVERERFDEA